MPTPVGGLANVVAIVAGNGHSLALRSDGTVWSWGAGYNGGLGTGSFAQSLVPAQVPGLTTAVAAAKSGRHYIGIDQSEDAVALSRERCAAMQTVMT